MGLFLLLNDQITQEEYLYQNNIELRFVHFPKYVYGLIYMYRDKILIAINKNLSDEKKRKTILHELAHFELKHMSSFVLEFKIENIEDEADEYLKSLIC